MVSYNNAHFRREKIMSHYLEPENKINEEDKINFKQLKLFSSKCADKLELFFDIKNHNLNFIKFDGEGCAIFLASVDIMISLIKQKNISEIKYIMENYKKILYSKKDYDKNILKDLNIFFNVSKNYNRLHCAEMILIALEKII